MPGNECSENDMAGIGMEEGARPLIVKNRIIGDRIEGWVRLLLADKAAKVIVNDKPSPAVSKP